MSKRFSQKVAALGLALTTAAWLGGAVLVAPASAATTSDISAQIQALQAQLQALESQLAAQGGSSSTASTCTFSRSLTVRSTGSDVKCLQQYLNASGDTVAKTGAGSSGNETTYFGLATKAAVAKWQAANGVTPASGYFGPISRAEYVKLTASTGTTTGTTTGGTGTTTGTGTGTNVPASGLAVSLASNSAAAGSIIAGAGQVPVGNFTFTASNAKGETITGLTFTKVGVVSDSNITNMYLADSTGKIVAQYQSLSSGVSTFTGLSLNVAAGESVTYTLKVDVSTGASAGNTIAWQLTGVTVSSGDTVTGTPVTAATQTLTTVSNPSIASATFTFNSVGSSVNAGTTGVLVADVTANVTNNAVWLNNVKFTEVGSANAADIQNLKLMVSGTQVGTTLPSLASDGTAYFDLSSAKAKLGTGNTDIQLYADIMGSPNRTAQFTILHTYDVNVTDSQYNSGISASVTTTNATTISILAGSLTVNTDSTTPTGNVAEGVSAVTLGKFDVKAAGEAVRIKFLDAKIVGTGWTFIASSTADLTNVRIIDDVGGQVGSTISTIATGSTTGTCTYANTSTLTCHFGDSSSNINYTIPANTTRVLSVVADLASTVTATAFQASLPGNASNAIGQISNATITSGAATGSSLTVVTNSLVSATDSGVGTMTYAVGAQAVKIGSFTLTASSAQGVNVTSLTVDTAAEANLHLQNLKLMVNGSQWGTTVSTVTTSAATGYTVSGSSPINVPAGQVVVVGVYADILNSSTAATYAGAVTLNNWTATGAASGSSIAFDSTRTGQSVVVSSGPTVTLAVDNTSPVAGQVYMGSTGNTLYLIDATNNNVEPVNLTKVVISDSITNNVGSAASFKNLTLWNGSTQVAGPVQMAMTSNTTGTITFNPTATLQVPQNQTLVLTLKGDVATFSSGGAQSTSSHVFKIAAATTDVTGIGASSNGAATVTGSPTATASNAQVVLESTMGVSVAALKSGTLTSKSTTDRLGTVTLSASAGGTVYVQEVKVTFTGSALASSTISNAFLQAAGLQLLNPAGNSIVSANSATLATTSGCATASATCSATWYFNTSAALPAAGAGYQINAGQSATFTLQVDSTTLATGSTTNAVGLTTTVAQNADIEYSDGTSDGTSVSITPTPPTQITSVSYTL